MKLGRVPGKAGEWPSGDEMGQDEARQARGPPCAQSRGEVARVCRPPLGVTQWVVVVMPASYGLCV